MKELIVNNKNEGQRLDKYLKKVLSACPTSILYKSFRKKNITVNDKKCTGNEILVSGDLIKIFFSDETFDKFSAGNVSDNSKNVTDGPSKLQGKTKELKKSELKLSDMKISVIYEDDDYIFLNKPAGILCQKASKDDLSLNDWLRDYLKSDKALDYNMYRPSCVNRIDRNTSGLVMCAKTYKGSRILSDIISSHKLKKFYIAICHGVIKESIILKGFHYKDEKKNVSRVCNTLLDVPEVYRNDAKEIETIISPVKNNGVFSLVDIQIITGKSHQIRTHLASIGHPLCGDIKYGGAPYKGRKYQLLHAMRVIFPHDDALGNLSGKTIEATMPNIYSL